MVTCNISCTYGSCHICSACASTHPSAIRAAYPGLSSWLPSVHTQTSNQKVPIVRLMVSSLRIYTFVLPQMSLKFDVVAPPILAFGGHRGYTSILIKSSKLRLLAPHGIRSPIVSNIQTFLHCSSAADGSKIPRPLASQEHASAPYKLLHFDFCMLPRGVASGVVLCGR
jgi:hypothetical protein